MAEPGEEESSSGAEAGLHPFVGGASGGGDGTHYLAKCVLHGSAVLHAVQGHFRYPHSTDIIFGKETSLELVMLGKDGFVESVFEQSVFGIIKDLAVLPWNSRYHELTKETRGKDLLIVLSDSGKLSFVTFSSDMHRFFAIKHIELSKPGNSKHQLGRMLTVDPGGCFIAVSAYEDRFAVFPVYLSADGCIGNEKIIYSPENGEANVSKDGHWTSFHGTIWSMCFISGGTYQTEVYNPILAIVMHRRNSVTNDLLLFGCDIKTNTMCAISQYSEAGPLVLHVSAVPHLSGFAFLFRIGDMLLLDLRDPDHIYCLHKINLNISTWIEDRNSVEESYKGVDNDDDRISNVAASALLELRDSGDDMVKDDDPMSIDSGSSKGMASSKYVCSWTWEPDTSFSSKLLLCLDSGEIFMVRIFSNFEGVQVDLSDCLYRGFPLKVLCWRKDGYVAGLVEMGDGMVLKFENDRLIYKSSIQNIAPILDLCFADYHDEKQDQMFACCGMSPEGSLRIIRSGISVEKLVRTPPVYQGVTGIWTLRMKQCDDYDSFLVLSFFEETRILSVGISFNDVSDGVGFQLDLCTLACGLVVDGLLVQIHKYGVRLCQPTLSAHPDGIPVSAPISTAWSPDNMTISVGAVGKNMIIVATSNPCFLFILGVASVSNYHYEISEIRHLRLQYEVSCIYVAPKSFNYEQSSSEGRTANKVSEVSLHCRFDISMAFVIGTHKPSVEIYSLSREEDFRILAVGTIAISNALNSPISGCIPEDVKLVAAGHPYVLAGLRNGMILRFEWPEVATFHEPESNLNSHLCHFQSDEMVSSLSSPAASFSSSDAVGKASNRMPVSLQLIAIRHIGITPVVLVPFKDSLDADMIVLSDRPWVLHTARHSLAYTSISFELATHVTPVHSSDCPRGIMFVAENSLHLVEMVHCKRLNMKKFSIGGTPRKVLYHNESKTLLVLRTGLNNLSSDICRVDPFSGTLISKFECELGETAKCMQIVKVGKEHVLVVGTSQSSGRNIIMASGEAESVKGRLILLRLDCRQGVSEGSSLSYGSNFNMSSDFDSPLQEFVGYASSSHSGSPGDTCLDEIQLEEAGAGQLQPIYQNILPGAVLSVCSYLDHYILASAGNILYVFGFVHENPQKLRKYATGKTRFTITCLKTSYSRIAVGDCRDGILFYSYHEDLKKLEQLYSDPSQRLIADCALIDCGTAVVSDRRGNISVLSCPSRNLEVNEDPEKNLVVNCSFYMGETVMSIQKDLIACKRPRDTRVNIYDDDRVTLEYSYDGVVASTLLGSVFILIPIMSKELALLEAVQARLAVHPLTSPLLGNDHKEYRSRGMPAGAPIMLDGDMLAQFLELTTTQQELILSPSNITTRGASVPDLYQHPLSVNQVVRVLERLHYALN